MKQYFWRFIWIVGLLGFVLGTLAIAVNVTNEPWNFFGQKSRPLNSEEIKQCELTRVRNLEAKLRYAELSATPQLACFSDYFANSLHFKQHHSKQVMSLLTEDKGVSTAAVIKSVFSGPKKMEWDMLLKETEVGRVQSCINQIKENDDIISSFGREKKTLYLRVIDCAFYGFASSNGINRYDIDSEEYKDTLHGLITPELKDKSSVDVKKMLYTLHDKLMTDTINICRAKQKPPQPPIFSTKSFEYSKSKQCTSKEVIEPDYGSIDEGLKSWVMIIPFVGFLSWLFIWRFLLFGVLSISISPSNKGRK